MGSEMTVTVDLGPRSYDIDVGRGLLDQLGARTAARMAPTRAIVVTDRNVATHAQRAADSLARSGFSTSVLEIEPGEPSKSIDVAARLWDQMLGLRADRRSAVFAVGGGVVGDLAGFVAATFARGIDLVQVPTTLLAQVDSSVGGKVGVNRPAAKNCVGAFWQPKYVLIDTDVLATLPDREYCAGLAEVVKYGVILDAPLFQQLEQHIAQLHQRDDQVLTEVIARSCQLKALVVQQDERETSGYRAILNYGHTFGHALETATAYGQLLHGEAVAIGMTCAARLACRRGWIDRAWEQRQRQLLAALNLPTQVPPVDLETVMQAIERDKKVDGGILRFVLPRRLGHVELVSDVDTREIIQVLDECRAH